MARKAFLIQFAVTALLSLMNFSIGYCTVWPSYTLRFYEDNPTTLGGTYLPYHSDLVGSLPMLGSFFATIFGAALADLIGRKKAELTCGLICLLSFALICTAQSINMILAGRFLTGLGQGLCVGTHSLFISEYTEDATRGTMMSLVAVMYTTGILVSYLVGWLCSYDVVNYASLTLAVVFTIGVCLLKESPAYLLKNGKHNEALESLKFYRGTRQTTQEILDELSNMKNLIQIPNAMTNIAEKHNHNIDQDPEKEKLKQEVEELFKPQPKMNAWKTLCASKSTQRGILLSSLLVILLVFMGMIAVQTYAGKMFVKAVPSLSPDVCSVALAVFNMLGCFVPLVLSDHLGRRALMITSCVLVTFCLFMIGALLRWSFAPDWVVPAFMLAYCFCFQLGIGCVPLIFLSECFMPELKTLCQTIVLCLMWISNFVILAVFRPMVDLIGMDGAFFAFAAIAAVTTVISFVMLPETAGLSAEAIQVLFNSGYVHIRRRKPLEK